MGNVNMEASQINYRGGSKKMSVEEAIKAAGTEITPEEKEWIDTIPELASQEIIAPEFDAEEGVYAVGDLVIYQGGLYQFTTAHETAGAWNAEEVAAVKVSDEIDSLKSGLTNLIKVPTVSGGSAITSVAGGTDYHYTATSDGYLTLQAPLAQDAREINAIIRDTGAPKYGVSIYTKVVANHAETLGGLFVKAGRTYYINNVGSNSVDLYLST